MRATTQWLSEAEKSAIVDEAVELLDRVGMRYAGSAVLPLLEERGAQVDHATGIARLPRELVEWAAGQCPRSVLMAGLTEADDVLLDEGEPFHFVPSGCVAKTLDFRTGRAPRQHAAGPARVHGADGRTAATRHHVDAGQRVRRPARAA